MVTFELLNKIYFIYLDSDLTVVSRDVEFDPKFDSEVWHKNNYIVL